MPTERYVPRDPRDAQDFIDRAVANDGWGLDGRTLAALYKGVEAALAPYRFAAKVAEVPRLPAPRPTQPTRRLLARYSWLSIAVIRRWYAEAEPRA